MEIHSVLDAGWGRVVKMATVTSWDRFQLRAKWEIPGEYEERLEDNLLVREVIDGQVKGRVEISMTSKTELRLPANWI